MESAHFWIKIGSVMAVFGLILGALGEGCGAARTMQGHKAFIPVAQNYDADARDIEAVEDSNTAMMQATYDSSLLLASGKAGFWMFVAGMGVVLTSVSAPARPRKGLVLIGLLILVVGLSVLLHGSIRQDHLLYSEDASAQVTWGDRLTSTGMILVYAKHGEVLRGNGEHLQRSR